MFRDAQSPADYGAVSLGIGVRDLPDSFGGYAGLALGALQGVLFDALAILRQSAGRVVDEPPMGQPGGDDLPAHRVRQRDIGSDIEPQPHVRPLRGGGPPRVHHEQAAATANPLQHMMEKNRVRLPRVGTPQQDDVRLFYFTIRAGSPARSEYRRQTGDAGGVSSTVAAVDVVAADHRPDKLLGHII